ncbi:MAG: hypothetical protein SFU27_00800 [Thermonemataceae bacterium]|nr:hypothetical protein [Thermonemataceae bacterium]
MLALIGVGVGNFWVLGGSYWLLVGYILRTVTELVACIRALNILA